MRLAATSIGSNKSGFDCGVTCTALAPIKLKNPTLSPPTVLINFVWMTPAPASASSSSSAGSVAANFMLLARIGKVALFVTAACRIPASPWGVQSSSWLPMVVAS
jgi:hypothetical protein